MKAIILAAGRGSRLHALTDSTPKCLVPVRGRPLLEYQLSALREGGAGPVALVTGYLQEQLVHRADHHFPNPRWENSSIVASLLCATAWLEESDCIVSYSDIFYPASFVHALSGASDSLGVAYDPDGLQLWTQRFEDPMSDAESLVVDSAGWLKEIGAKRPGAERVQGQYIGLVRTTPAAWHQARAVLDALDPQTVCRLDITAFLALLLSQGVGVRAVAVRGLWGEVDSAHDIEVYERLYGSRLDALPFEAC